LIVTEEAPGKMSGHFGLGWPLLFSLAIHLTIVLAPMPRGQWAGRSDIPIEYFPARLPLTVAFRSASSPPEQVLVLSAPDTDESAKPETTAAQENAISPRPAPDISSASELVSDSREYLPPERLTRLPEILDMGNLDLPGVVNRADKGRLVLEILISDEGHPDSIRVVETSVPGPFLANALRVFQWARYVPGRELNRAARSRIRVEIVLGMQPSDPGRGVVLQNGSATVLKKFDSVPQ
jgi:hypothetical protein